jgi:hypothetical protein
MLKQDGHRIVRHIGRPPGEYFIHDDAETIDIRPRINGARPHLLRGHVGRRPQQHSSARQACIRMTQRR